MPQFRAWPRQDRRRHGPAARRGWLALLMVTVVALTAMLHGLAGEHTAVAASHSDPVSALTLDVGGEPCCPPAHHSPTGATCSAAGSCPLCVPPAEPAALPLPVAAPTEAVPEAPRSEALLFPHFRPPKALPTV